MNRGYFLIIILLFPLLVSSCSKSVTGSRLRARNLNRDKLGIDEVKFDYLTIKSKIEFHEASSTRNATALIRVKKDSILWFNLSGTFGLQGVRGILTQDSIKMLSRVDKEYWLMNYDDLSREFNFKIDYSIIQAMVLGEMPKEKQDNEQIKKEKGRYVIHQNFGDIYIDNYISAKTRKVTEVSILETPTKNSMTLLYGDFQVVEEQFFPFTSFISLVHNNEFGELETKVNIEHARVDFADKELKFPFSIPNRYVRR